MLVAVSSTGVTLDSPMDPRFGRAAYFIVAETETMEYSAVDNAGNRSGSGAGIAAAQAVANRSVTAVITGNVGPNATEVLQAAKIGIFRGEPGTARENILHFTRGELAAIESTAGKQRGRP